MCRLQIFVWCRNILGRMDIILSFFSGYRPVGADEIAGKKAVLEMAEELLKVEALRQAQAGFWLFPDNHYEQESPIPSFTMKRRIRPERSPR